MRMHNIYFLADKYPSSKRKCENVGWHDGIETETEVWEIVDLYTWLKPSYAYFVLVAMGDNNNSMAS